MIVKPAKPSTPLKNILILTGLLLVLIAAHLFINKNGKKAVEIVEAMVTPEAVLTQELSLLEVFDYFDDHTIFLSVNDEASEKLTDEMRQKLRDIGGDTLANLALRQSYAAIFQHGKIVQEALQDSVPAVLDWGDTQVSSAGNKAGSFSKLKLNSVIYQSGSRGLNLFVVNKNGRMIGTWNFDFYAHKYPVSSAFQKSGSTELEGVEIEIEEQHFKKLKAKRDQAVKNEVLLSGDEDLVPATLFFKGKEYKVKMRLKGDWTDHLRGKHWSFRVKLGGSDALLGMKKFSLHQPKTRNYAGEWLYQQVLADEGIMNLQYHFVNLHLKVKGEFETRMEDLGIYALEEAFDKQVIERNQRREGIILKLDEGLMWEERAAFLDSKLTIPDLQFFEFPPYEDVNVIPFSQKRVVETDALYSQYLNGSALFRDFINGKKLPSEVFDIELLAKYHALTNLMGADHALAPHNYRVYYNPVTSKLEPIGFDGNAGYEQYSFMDYHGARQDAEYQAAYVRAVEEITTDEYIERLNNWPSFDGMVKLMKDHFPEYNWEDNVLIHNQKTLIKRVHPAHCLRVNFMDIGEGKFTVSIDNFGHFPVEVRDLIYQKSTPFSVLPNPVVLRPDTRTTVSFPLDRNYQNLFTKKGLKKAGFDPKTDLPKVEIVYNTLGSNQKASEVILPWDPDRKHLAASDPFQRTPNARDFEFLVFDEKAKTITCRAGHWQLEKPLTIPAGYTFVAGPGCRLELMSQFISIFSFSPIRFVGSPSNPVEVFSNTGYGAGLLVLNAKDTSRLEHCRFAGLSNPSTEGWSVTGAVNFYQSDVVLENCTFSNNRCEDALNILKSHFSMAHCIFTNIHADAFDGDFIQGAIRDCAFGNIGNDAIDVSGSKLTVERVAIKNAGDKGISAGEDSHIKATSVEIIGSEIAIASKDQSTFDLSNCILTNNQLCFTAFQKKPEFGPGHIVANDMQLIGCTVEHLIEKGSSLLLNGVQVETVEAVKEKMYGVEFGKSSK